MRKRRRGLKSSAAARDIGIRILSSDLEPRSRIAGEVEASEGMRMSRTTYREAVRILVAKGLIETRPRFGARVAAVEHWHLLDREVMSWVASSGAEHKYRAALIEFSELFEPEAVCLAAVRRNAAQLAQLKVLVSQINSLLASSSERKDAMGELRKLMGRASGNQTISYLVEAIVLGCQFPPPIGAILGRYSALLRAVESADGVNARNHMRLILEDMALTLQQGSPGLAETR